MSDNLMSMAAFREATGASESAVSRWLKKGLPCQRFARPGGGRAQVFFDQTAAMGWVALHGNQTQRRRAIALAQSVPDAGQADSKNKPSTPQDEEGLVYAVERLKKQELASHRLLIRLKERGDLNAVLALQENHVKELRALAVLENSALQFRVRQGELVNYAASKAVYLKVITGIKNSVLGIPSSATLLLLPLLADPDRGKEVCAILDRLCRDALRSVADTRSRPDPAAPSGL